MLDTLLRSLTPLLEPVGFVWLCLWIAAVWLWIKKRRGVAVFHTAGVPVVCVPCDFQTEVSIETEWRWAWVPSCFDFEKVSLYIHEQIGWWTYRWRGWIKV